MRKDGLTNAQHKNELAQHKILRTVETRWISHYAPMERVLEQMPVCCLEDPGPIWPCLIVTGSGVRTKNESSRGQKRFWGLYGLLFRRQNDCPTEYVVSAVTLKMKIEALDVYRKT